MSGDTAAVRITILSFDRVREGRVRCYADVLIDIDGIELTLRGVQAVARPPGRIAIEPPRYRRGPHWLPAVMLPPEVSLAIGDLVAAALGIDTRTRYVGMV